MEKVKGDEKNAHLKKLENAAENLQLFKADLLNHNSLSVAITGCSGVFHVASPVPSGRIANPEVELIALTGTRNVLRTCTEAKVKRIVVVSSVAAVLWNPNQTGQRVRLWTSHAGLTRNFAKQLRIHEVEEAQKLSCEKLQK